MMKENLPLHRGGEEREEGCESVLRCVTHSRYTSPCSQPEPTPPFSAARRDRGIGLPKRSSLPPDILEQTVPYIDGSWGKR